MFLSVLAIEPYLRVRLSNSLPLIEKYTYISELSDTVVSGCGIDALTSEPTRYGSWPTVPLDGAFTTV